MPGQKFPPPGKEFFFKNQYKTVQVAQCVKSRASNRVIDSIILIKFFGQKCFILEGVL